MTGGNADLSKIVEEIRGYRGVRRKSDIQRVLPLISDNRGFVIAAKGEDGAVMTIGDEKLVFAADGIIEEMIENNPSWAGYCSILVNVNDILAMRGRPVAAVNVISAKDKEVLEEVVAGMKDACGKFGVEMVGGHLHPDSAHNEISVAMMGRICGGAPLLSTTAKPGEAVIVICDRAGEFTQGLPYSWDTTSMRSKKEMAERVDCLLDAFSFMSSGKDISNPGLLGTLAMLLESSGTGAVVDIGKIPKPDGVDMIQWLKAYQGFGFIGTAPAINMRDIRMNLEESGLTVAAIGKVQSSKKFIIKSGESQKTLFDLGSEKITGLF